MAFYEIDYTGNNTEWAVCEYLGDGRWRPISFWYIDPVNAIAECERLFKERGGAFSPLPSIGVIDNHYEFLVK